MAIYAVGDVQGCYDQLRKLLRMIEFVPSRDQLWLCGDLVNRGPKSLETLRFVRDLGDAAVTVLGNHDLHLIASAREGGAGDARHASLQYVLDAPDADELIDWLAERPFYHASPEHDAVLVHAGVPPGWTRRQVEKRSARLKKRWRKSLLDSLREPPPPRWDRDLKARDKHRYTCAALTRIRFVNQAGVPEYSAKGHPDDYTGTLRPWFDFLTEDWRGTRIFFGHWSTLGPSGHENVISLDSGCVWGRALSAVRVDGRRQRNRRYDVSCAGVEASVQG